MRAIWFSSEILRLTWAQSYGEKIDYSGRHPLMRTLTIPATTLHTHNLEILIQAIPSIDQASVRPLHTYLIPGLEVASSAAARYSVIRHPVHKALIYGEGLRNLATYGNIVSAQNEEKDMVKGTINRAWTNLQSAYDPDTVVPINVECAEAAIRTFRESLTNSVEYEHAWFDSGLPPLSGWFFEGTISTAFKPTVRRLIASLLSDTENRILAEEAERLQQLKSSEIPSSTRSNLSRLLSAWSENAHTELRDQLDLAFDSHAWRKLAWWKLLWRVDDVAMLAAEILNRSWLVSAEKELIWIAGRVVQAGLHEVQQSGSPRVESGQKADREPLQMHQAAIFSASVPEPFVKSLFPTAAVLKPELSLTANRKPYPQTIAQARQVLSLTTTPSLQAVAQGLLAGSLSLTFLTSSISALMYLSISTTSIYESGTIAALGLVYSLRRLQKRWEEVRASWKQGLREQGRLVLRMLEKHWKDIIEEGGRQPIDKVNLEERSKAREAVAKVRSVLGAKDLQKS